MVIDVDSQQRAIELAISPSSRQLKFFRCRRGSLTDSVPAALRAPWSYLLALSMRRSALTTTSALSSAVS
jgi:hypothetical protein